MFTAKLYSRTGFDLFNIPDSEETLNAAAGNRITDVPAMDILQLLHLSSITIRATEDQVDNVDFLKLIKDEHRSAFYVVDGYEMTSGDTATLYVTMEPILTGGGINNIKRMDGTVSRHHLAEPETTGTAMNLYDYLHESTIEEDPLLVPSYPTVIKYQKMLFMPPVEHNEGLGDVHYMPYGLVVEATIPIDKAVNFKYDIGDVTQGDGLVASMGEYDGYIPTNEFSIRSPYDRVTYDTFDGTPSSVTAEISCITSNNAMKGFKKYLAQLEANNLTGIITGCYYVPMKWFSAGTQQAWAQIISGFGPTHFFNAEPSRDDLEPIPDTVSDATSEGFPTLYSQQKIKEAIQNGFCSMQPFIGKYNELIFIATASGDTRQYNVENLLQSDCRVYAMGIPDPRKHGGVQFTVEKYDPYIDHSDWEFEGHDSDVIDGGRWIPESVSSIGQTGYNINQRLFNSQQKIADVKTDVQAMSGWDKTKDGGGVFDVIGAGIERFKTAASAGYGLGSIGAAFDPNFENPYQMDNRYTEVGRGVVAGNERAITIANRRADKAAELAQFSASNAPHPIAVGSSGSGDLDIHSYALVCFHRVLDQRDIEKFIAIQSRFGCKHTAVFDKSYLNNRRNFNYIEMTGCNIYELENYTLESKVLREEMADAFNNGVRIWHVPPKTVVNVPTTYPGAWNNPYPT